MTTTISAQQTQWPVWKKVIFRFFFVYLALQMAPWSWLPGTDFLTKYYFQLSDWAVGIANSKFFHVRKVLVPQNGSGDTSMGWATLWFYILLAIIACVIWSLLDRKREDYAHLNYWLCLFARYYIAMVAFGYGIIKIFGWQMPFPNLHQLSTPLGDFLPMRLSWMFIGYSAPYQAFAGLMEMLAASLLLFRRTTTLGVMLATVVFINVMMLNLSYDIPVKIFSMQLVFTCLFLLANESNRIMCFFFLNKPADVCHIYHFNYTKKWMKISRIILKCVFILCFLVVPFFSDVWNVMASSPILSNKPKHVLKDGVYDVIEYDINKQSIPITLTDTIRWQDMILDGGGGSIKTADTTFIQKYNRGYFGYKVDTVKHTMSFTKSDKVFLTMNYVLPDTATIKLSGKKGNDSLFVELKRSKRHFQLAERQFHWLSEHNR